MKPSLPSIPWARARERAGGVAFALVLNALLLLALFTMAPRIDPQVEDDSLKTFDISPAKKARQEKARAEKSQERREERQAASAAPAVRPPQPVRKPAEQPPSPFPFLTLDSSQMAAADIGRMTSKGPGDAAEGDSKAVAGPGEGPGGVQLFEAQWYREPTNAELSTYMPANAPPVGYGLVACKTIDHYHVENCQVLGEEPLGSGFGKAVRLAAWQFLVLPPRVNGKLMVGSWVKIRITYTTRGVEVR